MNYTKGKWTITTLGIGPSAGNNKGQKMTLTQANREYARCVAEYGENNCATIRALGDLQKAKAIAKKRREYARERNEALRVLTGTSARQAKIDMGL